MPPILFKMEASELVSIQGCLFFLPNCLPFRPFGNMPQFSLFPTITFLLTITSSVRPLCLATTISKLFDTVVYGQLHLFLRSEGLLNECQYGFRSRLPNRWSTDTRLTIWNHGVPCSVFLDISKALHPVGHQDLLVKLLTFGFSPSLLLQTSSCRIMRTISA